jgi:hypothetical protein
MSRLSGDALLSRLERDSFSYFQHEVNPTNGLVKDKTKEDWPASIAAVGFALSAYPLAVERGFMKRSQAIERTLAALRFFWNSSQSTQPDATGYKGFYYHFLDMKTGRRAWKCELSTVDTAFLLAGALTAAAYFQGSGPEEEIRDLADKLYRRADWRWAQDGEPTVIQGWTPEGGFLKYRWEGYDEALLLYLLALGSPTHPVSEESYRAWHSSYKWKKIYGHEMLYAGSLFIHHYSHIWVDFRGVRDEPMRQRGLDYFENSRRAAYIQQQYAIRNPRRFAGYSDRCWGVSASDGPGPEVLKVNGVKRYFYDYRERGVPYGPDDGTIAPWAVVASLPFAPEIVMPTLEYFEGIELRNSHRYGYKATYNPTFPKKRGSKYGWVSPWHFAINEGPIVLMIANHHSNFVWQLMRGCPYLVSGLQLAGFAGGWLARGARG